MAHDTVHQSNTKIIWKVFVTLSVITILEVWLGIVRPDFLVFNDFLGTHILNWIFIILTLAKAYGIAWYFMHLKNEKIWFRRVIAWTGVFLIVYLMTLLLIEGNYLYDTLSPLVKW